MPLSPIQLPLSTLPQPMAIYPSWPDHSVATSTHLCPHFAGASFLSASSSLDSPPGFSAPQLFSSAEQLFLVRPQLSSFSAPLAGPLTAVFSLSSNRQATSFFRPQPQPGAIWLQPQKMLSLERKSLVRVTLHADLSWWSYFFCLSRQPFCFSTGHNFALFSYREFFCLLSHKLTGREVL